MVLDRGMQTGCLPIWMQKFRACAVSFAVCRSEFQCTEACPSSAASQVDNVQAGSTEVLSLRVP